MIMFGYGRWEKIREQAQVCGRSVGDVAAVCRAMIAVMLQIEAVSISQVPTASIAFYCEVPWLFLFLTGVALVMLASTGSSLQL